jgi:hypothetical protein
MTAIAVTQIKDVAHSADGTQVTFTFMTKDAGEIAVTMPTSCLEELRPPKPRAPTATRVGDSVQTKGTLHRPKKWMLGAETTKHKVVALIFDPQTSRESGFALSPKAAKDLAAGLVKSADTVSTYRPPKPN